MERWGAILLSIGIVLAGGAFVAWLIWRSIKRSDDPPGMMFKWVCTAVLLGGFIGAIVWLGGPSYASAGIAPVLCVVLGIAMSVLWAPNIAVTLATPITSLFDGGNREPDLQPYYSVAMTQRNRGHYDA